MTTNPGLSWGSPFSSVNVLDLTPPGTSGAALCTDDGTVLYGRDDDGSLARAVSWPGPPGTAVTTLDDPNAAVKSWITCSTPDGSVQVGVSGDDQSAYWTTGGTVATILTPGAGFLHCRASGEQQRAISNDGTIIVGGSTGVPNTGAQATVWTSGTPSLLANPTFLLGSLGATSAQGCSADGSIIVGVAIAFFGAEFTGTSSLALFWSSTTPLALSGFLSTSLQNTNSVAHRCLADGSVIYGRANAIILGAQKPCYWDALATIDPTSGAAGVLHFLDFLSGGNSASVTYCAEVLVGGQPVAVGSGNDGSGNTFAIKWTATAAVSLGGLSGGNRSFANACSSDGSVVVGLANDGDGIFWPVYWDASNVIHQLPTVADPLDAFQGEALGVSRDGLVIFGDGDQPDGPGVPVPFCGVHHTSASFTASWVPSGAAATSYTVDWRKVGDVSFTEVTGITDTFLLITGLDAAASYEFKVKALNAAGESAFSELITCATIGLVQFLVCDSHWTITQPQTLLYGLDHLAGLSVTGLLDGIPLEPTQVALDGTLTLPFPASSIVIGLGYPVQVQTPYLDTGNPTVQGRRKDIVAVTVRVDSSATPDVGSNQLDGGAQVPTTVDPPWVDMFPAVTTSPELLPVSYVGPSGQTTTKLFSGDFRANVQAGWDERGQTAVQQTLPLPLSITAVVPEVVEGDSSEQGYAQKNQGQQQGQRGPGPWMLRN